LDNGFRLDSTDQAGTTDNEEFTVETEVMCPMADERIQGLYDLAFQKWQEKDKDAAAQLIDEALSLLPNDPALNALAYHIKRLGQLDPQSAVHAERILDVDVHYLDVIDNYKNGRGFAHMLMLHYPVLIMQAEDRRNKDPLKEKPSKENKRAEELRMVTYGTKLLEAGYGIPNLDAFTEALASLEMHDVVINIGLCTANLKTSAEIGLPGLDHCDTSDFFEPLEDYVAASFTALGQDRAALDWCKALIAQDSDNWGYFGILGEICCRLGLPAEAARQWIISHQKGAHTEFLESHISSLCNMVSDPKAALKEALWHRVREVKPKLSADKAGIMDKLTTEIYTSIGDSKHPILEESYVTHKLETELPALTPSDFFQYRAIWLPNQGPYPFAPKPSETSTSEEIESPIEPSAVVARVARSAPKTIESLGVDLTARAREGRIPPIVGRDKEIDCLVRILLRMEKNNPVLLGEAGVGKTAVLQGLAQRIAAESVPEYLRGRRVFEISMSALVGGTMWRGDFESRITNLIHEARDNEDIILFVDELHTIMGAGAAQKGDLDAANIVKPALAKGELRLVGATTNEEYAKYIEKDPAMARRFTPVRVPELSRAATLEVLKARRDFWRESHRVEISDELLALAVELTGLHVSHRRFPDKAIDLLDESSALAETRRVDGDDSMKTLTEADVRRVLMEWTGAAGDQTSLPKENGDGRANLPSKDKMRAAIRERFLDFGTDVNALSDLAAQVRLSFKNPSTPLTALFHGPSRSGKTTCVNALAEALWPGDTDRVLTLNLSNYTDSAGLGRLIGPPPGFPGHNEQGLLTARLRRQPYGIVLLKNLDAAHPQVTSFFADALQNGRYSDNRRGTPVSTADSLFVLHVDMETHTRPVGFHTAESLQTLCDEGPALQWLESRDIRIPITHVLGFVSLKTDSAALVIRMHLDALRNAYAQKGFRFAFADTLIARLVEELMALSIEKRDAATLIDRQVRPLIRSALLSRNPDNPSKEIHIG
jgi:ATP-dependent Clp protease ATP-binding subunit ClpC